MFDWCIKHPTQVAVIALLICVLGVVAAVRIPVQMIPDLDVRTISVVTRWPGATPQDVEKEILIEQEDYLQNVPGVQRMISTSGMGSADIELEFPSTVDVNDALVRVLNALSQVPGYPENVDEPRVLATSFSSNSFIYFAISDTSGKRTPEDVLKMFDFVVERVKPRIERVPGVSNVRVQGAPEQQIRINVDLSRLALVGITMQEVRDAIRDRNRDISAGDISSGKRLYLVRTIGRLQTPEELKSIVIRRTGDSVTRLGDVADVELGLYEARTVAYQDGKPSILASVSRETGSNVIDIRKQVMEVVEEINRDILGPVDLLLYKTSDDVRYVEASISNVWRNLILGAIAATIVLWLFLRSVSGTLICVAGIPICTIAGFIGLMAAGRTINVISLAGVAFAIGMTVDNAIVVLESIEKQRRQGYGHSVAALQGVKEVWTSVLASTMTTIIVFAPVWLIQEEAGQLFSDISIAISGSILASMLVAIAIIPTASVGFKRLGKIGKQGKDRPKLVLFFEAFIERLVTSTKTAVIAVLVSVGLSGGIIYFLTPSAEYLPEGEEAKIFCRLLAPPGYNLEMMESIGRQANDYFSPYFVKNGALENDDLDKSIPPISRMLMIIGNQRTTVVAETYDPSRIDELRDIFAEYFKQFPGIRNFNSRGSIISSNDGGSRSVNLDIGGSDLNEIYKVAEAAYRRAFEVFEEPSVNSTPSALSLQQPMVEIRPNWDRVAELGFTNASFGFTVRALTDGAYVDEFILDGRRIDVFLYSGEGEVAGLDTLANLPIYAPIGGIVSVNSVAQLVEKVDTDSIRRLNGERTVTLNIIPPKSVALEDAVGIVREEIVNHLRDQGIIHQGVVVDVTGAGDQLQQTREALFGNFFIAFILSYLLLSAVFSHWGFSWIILTTVPIGIAGGIGGLWILNAGGSLMSLIGLPKIQQPFDMITMLGFLILLGTVVNNPILIVSGTIDRLRTGGEVAFSVRDATLSRIRPILMSTTTTVVGIAPLVLFPGAGTELYRGVGAIVLFGLLFSTFVTLVFLPSFLVLCLKVVKLIRPNKYA
jgi:multidrug efflux pump subunit AcrB